MARDNSDVPGSTNFNSTANLTKNLGFQSSVSIASKDVTEKAYNPFEHRQVEHPNSVLGSIAHLLKACLGTGILAMPAAFKNSGYLVGIIGTMLAGLVCTHTVYILVRTSQSVCVDAKKPSMGFAETCGAAFTYGPKPMQRWGGFIKSLIDYCLGLCYISVLCVYVVFIGSSMKEVFDVYIPHYGLSVQACCALTLLPLVVICQIRNLKYLVPCSTLANIIVVVVFGVTMYYMFTDIPSIKDREPVAPVSQWPLFLSTVVFAMEGIGVVMPVENEMANPKKFLGCPGVLNVSMTTVILLYGIFGFFGYLKYGDEVKGSVTLNLPQEHVIAQVAKFLMAIVIFLSYPLQFYVPIEFITRLLERHNIKYMNIAQIGIRTGIVVLSVAIAVSFPDLELTIGLAGAIFFSTLGLFTPAAVELVYRWDRGLGKFNYILYKNVIIMCISVIALVSGSYVSILGMMQSSKEHEGFRNETTSR